jgi:hypothetical protein
VCVLGVGGGVDGWGGFHTLLDFLLSLSILGVLIALCTLRLLVLRRLLLLCLLSMSLDELPRFCLGLRESAVNVIFSIGGLLGCVLTYSQYIYIYIYIYIHSLSTTDTSTHRHTHTHCISPLFVGQCVCASSFTQMTIPYQTTHT